jgi:hypothetical protein
MVVYKVLYKNYELKKGEFMGMWIERRKDLMGLTQVESGLRWAKFTFGRLVKDERTIFVLPNELKLGSNTKWLMEKGIFTEEEFLGMVKLVDHEMKR